MSGRQQNADIADTLQLRDIAMATIFGFIYMGADWRHLANTTEPSVCDCGGNAALCSITFTTITSVKHQGTTKHCGMGQK